MILIVGAGIGGLTLGAALRQNGIGFEIVERAAELRPVGGGIAFTSNVVPVMRALGLLDQIAARSLTIQARVFADERGGVLRRMLDDSGEPNYTLLRSELHQVLLQAAGPDSLRLGTTVRALVQEPAGVQVDLSDGTRAHYDLVVGCDGVHSSIRALSFDGQAPANAGYAYMRIVVPAPASAPQDEVWQLGGIGRQFGLVPLPAGRLYAFVSFRVAPDQPEPPADRLAHLRAIARPFGGVVPQVLSRVQASSEVAYNQTETVTLASWVSGRVVLLGDAAHAMAPARGQGGAMAIEDAFVLARKLKQAPSIDQALKAYEAERRPRVAKIQEQSRRLGAMSHASSRVMCALRNLLLKYAPIKATPPDPISTI